MDTKCIGSALLVVFIWGLNFSIIKFGLEELPPILFSGLRFLIVAIPAVFFVPLPKTAIWNVVGVGIFLGVLKFGVLFFAMKADASAGISSLLLQAQVIFTILLSVLLLKETVSRSQLIGIVLALSGFSFFFFTGNTNATLTGVLLVILAAFFWSVSNLIMKKTGPVNLLHFMVWASLIPPVPLFVISYFFETQHPIAILLAVSMKSWLSLAYVGYISTLIAFAIWGWLLQNHQSAAVTPFALLIPIVGISCSALLLGERMNTLEITGACLILLGLSISVTGRHLNKLLKTSLNH